MNWNWQLSDWPNFTYQSSQIASYERQVLLYDVYESYHQTLTHEMLWKWHAMLFKDQTHLEEIRQFLEVF